MVYLSIFYKIIFSFTYFKIIFIFNCTYLYVCVVIRGSWCGHICLGTYVEVIGQFEVVSFFSVCVPGIEFRSSCLVGGAFTY